MATWRRQNGWELQVAVDKVEAQISSTETIPRKFRTKYSICEANGSFDRCDPCVNGWFPAFYMRYVTQNFCLVHVSNLSVLNFCICLLFYHCVNRIRRCSSELSSGVLDCGLMACPLTIWIMPRHNESAMFSPVCMGGARRMAGVAVATPASLLRHQHFTLLPLLATPKAHQIYTFNVFGHTIFENDSPQMPVCVISIGAIPVPALLPVCSGAARWQLMSLARLQPVGHVGRASRPRWVPDRRHVCRCVCLTAMASLVSSERDKYRMICVSRYMSSGLNPLSRAESLIPDLARSGRSIIKDSPTRPWTRFMTNHIWSSTSQLFCKTTDLNK